MEGVDCTATINPLRIVRLRLAGKRFVCRYLAPPGAKYDWKRLTRAEVLACKATPGLELVCVFESYAGRALEGAAAGAADASTALALLNKLGIPAAPVYFAVDTDVTTPAQFAKVGAYLAAASQLVAKSRAGVYGEFDVVERFVGAVVRYGWQAAAWSKGKRSPKAQLYQHTNGRSVAGISVDLDTAYAADYGQASRPSPPKTKPHPHPLPVPPKPKLGLNIFKFWRNPTGRKTPFGGKFWRSRS